MLTNPRDAFRGQSRSPNIVSFRYTFLLCNSNFESLTLKTTVFLIFDFKKCRDLEIRVRGHLRPLKVVVLFERFRKIAYGFLLVFYRNIVPKMHRFLE